MASNLTEQQKDEFREAFSLFDKDNDGIITIKELPTVLKALGQNLSQKEIQEIDEDGSGGVDFDEFLDLMASLLLKSSDESEFRNAFALFDQDKDGFLSAAELRVVMANLGEKIAEEEAEAMVKEADFDGDGKVSYAEFFELMTDSKYS